MDKRISELRERLYKKKAEARQKENLPVRLEKRSTPRKVSDRIPPRLANWRVCVEDSFPCDSCLVYVAPLPRPRQLNRANGPPSPQPAAGTLGRVAAVGPYIQVPVPSRQDAGYASPPEPLKPHTLGVNNQANQGRGKSGLCPGTDF